MEMKPLNIFQRVMRIWDEAHPYNAAQILEIEGSPDVAAINRAWAETLEATGLGQVRMRGRHFRYERAEDASALTVTLDKGLDGFITQQLNERFVTRAANGDAVAMPLKAFVATRAGGDSFYMGIVYQHWVADSVSVRMVLREWFRRVYDPAKARREPLQVPTGGFWHFFGPRATGWRMHAGIGALVHSMRQFKGVRRLDGDPGSQDVACTLHRLPTGTIDGILAGAKRRGATFNDLMIAALARAADVYGAPPRRSGQHMAIGTIVDMRPMAQEEMEHIFGMFLGFVTTIVQGHTLNDREALLASVAAQSADQKRRKVAAMNTLRLAVGFAQARMMSERRLNAFYRHYMPMSGGVSNVNMNISWPAAYCPSPLRDFIRVAPSGPMVPVVVGATTFGKEFTFTLTRRMSLVNDHDAALLAQLFMDELTAWAKA